MGGTAELSCSVLYTQKDIAVVWTKVDPQVIISKDTTPFIRDSRYSLRYDSTSTTYTLQIKDLQESDAGTYKCQIWTSPVGHVSKELILQVYSPPIIYDNSSSTIVVGEEEPVKLECYASGVPKPQISWKRENNAVLPTGGTIYKGNILKINHVRKGDRGIYYCTADNRVGTKVKRSIAVEVEFAPTVEVTHEEVKQALHFDAELECRIEAYPYPIIDWYKDGIQLSSNNSHCKISRRTAVDQHTESILRVIAIEPKHYGTYFCKAANKLGEDKKKIELRESEYPVCPPACGSGHYSSGIVILPHKVLFLSSLFLKVLFKF